MTLSSIILFTYNRPNHTEQVLNALMQNDLADQSILYIYCDGPKKNANQLDLQKIKEVRAIVQKKQWCKEVNIIEREKNMGLANSVITGVTEIVNKYGKVIVLEDDIVTAKGFLKFMNEGLEMYKEEKKFFGVSGHTYIEGKTLPKSYFLPIGTSWGWGTTRNAWGFFNENSEYLLKVIQPERDKFNFGGFPYYQMLEKQSKGLVDSWAIRFYASMFLERGLFLFPNTSLLENIGIGEDGTHTKTKSPFFPTMRDNKISLNNSEVEFCVLPEVQTRLEFFFKKSLSIEQKSFITKLKHKIVRFFKEKF